ncbi:lipase 1 precursor [mine drainage metagenome]|uniref:Lipase 1 n=1 Tax=mine drainage metagenome TaxID=410659 RepID=A0A1J5QEJ6_9ZZZZ
MIWGSVGLIILLIAAAPVVAERLRRPMDARARRMGTGDFAELSRGLTYYQWIGPSRGPVVVCVHGLTTPSYVWLPLAQAMTALGIRVLIYDLYGRGLSDRVAGRQDRAFFVGQLHELLTALEVKQGVTLMGYSMGAAIAAAYAADHPALVDRLVLVAPCGLGIRQTRFAEFVARVPVAGDWLMRVAGGIMFRRGLNRTLEVDPALPDILDRIAGEMGIRGTLPAVLASQRGMLVADLADTHRTLAQTSLPVLGIWGAEDKVIPLSSLGRLAQINRAARVVEVDGATHALPYTHVRAIMSALTDFLRQG